MPLTLGIRVLDGELHQGIQLKFYIPSTISLNKSFICSQGEIIKKQSQLLSPVHQEWEGKVG